MVWDYEEHNAAQKTIWHTVAAVRRWMEGGGITPSVAAGSGVPVGVSRGKESRLLAVRCAAAECRYEGRAGEAESTAAAIFSSSWAGVIRAAS
jgi:hypothetical protein